MQNQSGHQPIFAYSIRFDFGRIDSGLNGVLNGRAAKAGASSNATALPINAGDERVMSNMTEAERNNAVVKAMLEKIPPGKLRSNPLSVLAEAAAAVNSSEFALPDDIRCPVELPGDDAVSWRNRAEKWRRLPHERDANGMVPRKPLKLCYMCSRCCRDALLVQCDFCPLTFHLDCLDPPLAAAPKERWMCPNHVEHALDQKLLHSLSLTERMSLWKKHARQPVDELSVKLDFLHKTHTTADDDRSVWHPPKLQRVSVPVAVKDLYRRRWRDPRLEYARDLKATTEEQNQLLNYSRAGVEVDGVLYRPSGSPSANNKKLTTACCSCDAKSDTDDGASAAGWDGAAPLRHGGRCCGVNRRSEEEKEEWPREATAIARCEWSVGEHGCVKVCVTMDKGRTGLAVAVVTGGSASIAALLGVLRRRERPRQPVPPVEMPEMRRSANSDNQIREPITEEELRQCDFVTPDQVLRLNKITSDYLCQPEDNVYEIEFTRFKIRDLDTSQVLFEIAKPSAEDDMDDVEHSPEEVDPNAGRFVRYQFTPQFLHLKHVGATVEFGVGTKPVNNFRMIERHFFRDRLLKSFDFEFGFCIPNSKNTCEHIYEFPQLSDNLLQEMINHPYETRSDSFYFVDDRLIMHNKADYAYNGGMTEL
uniref:PHD-type domain-containing protein n=1 Tax=Plectus sambesii TaxID=2011161 RepID=A0A914VW75_9BILA